jgi:hypothetical protein
VPRSAVLYTGFMSASDSKALRAISQQFAAALVAYEAELDALLRVPGDPEKYRLVSARMDEMRMYAHALPSVSVAWIELLIRHFEVTHGLHRSAAGAPADLELVRSQVGFAVAHVARKCGQLAPPGEK